MFEKLFNKHMKIERTIVICGMMMLAIFSVIIYDTVVLYNRNQTTLSDEPVLSGQVSSSLTETEFFVEGIYRSSDKTQMMVVLNGDLSQLSYAANSYEVYLGGKHAESYSGGVYAFGDLGKLCVYVTDTNGFETEKTEMLVKCSNPAGAKTIDDMDEMTFEINLGAKNVTEVPFMDDAGLNVEKMVMSAFFADTDNSSRAELTKLQKEMVDARSMLSNTRANIEKMGIELPVLPDWMMYNAQDESGNQIRVNDQIASHEDGTEYIQTSYVFPGAANFDWENTDSTQSYLEASGLSLEDLAPFWEGKKNDKSDGSAAPPSFERPKVEDGIPSEWYKTDGSVISNPTSSESTLIQKHNDAMSAYYAAKIAYQDALAVLIVSQNQYLESAVDYTSNVGDGALTGVKM